MLMESYVVALSVSTPKLENINGKDLRTSIVREPLYHPVYFDQTGPVGNKPADHIEDVFVYSENHYDYWCEEFNIERSSWKHAHWGENITLNHACEETLRIGDIVRIGNEAVLQVTFPRIPCFKLSWRLGQAISVLSDIIDSGRIGFYMNVIEPGTIEPNDIFTVIKSHPQHPTVAGISRMLQSSGTSIVQMLEVKSLPDLTPWGLTWINKKIHTIEELSLLKEYRWLGWRSFTINHIVAETHDIYSFYLSPSDTQAVPAFRPGQHLAVRLQVENEVIERRWSLSEYCPDKMQYRISIKKVDNGLGSSWMHAAKEGVQVEIKAPSGDFYLDNTDIMPIVLISGGIGVTPMLAMLQAHLLKDKNTRAPIYWIQCVLNKDNHPFRDDVLAKVEELGVHIHFVYSGPTENETIGHDYHSCGLLSVDKLMSILKTENIKFNGKTIAIPPAFFSFYLCGPKPMQQALYSGLKEKGVEKVFFEEFVSALAMNNADNTLDVATVTYKNAKKQLSWHLEDDVSLLELAEFYDLKPQYQCRSGQCHRCKVKVLEGKVRHTLSVEGIGEDEVLLCCGVPDSSQLIIDV